MSKPSRILIMAGGTGGHVFPGLAVANRMREQGWEVLWLGTKQGLEAQVIPKASIPIRYLTITGVRGKGILTRLLAPIRLSLALFQAIKVILTFKPDIVLGMGGFAAGPGGLAAWILRRPLIIHEQNAIAGVTNRILARMAKRVLEGFPNSFPAAIPAVWVGNPLREELLATHMLQDPKQKKDMETPLNILIVGGSRGALALNQLVPKALALIAQKQRPNVWHQTGIQDLASTEDAYRSFYLEVNQNAPMGNAPMVNTPDPIPIRKNPSPLALVVPFIQDMAMAYRWADLVICRSGALTVAELAMMRVPSILVPFPFAVDDHQTHNGHFLEKEGAAKLIPQSLLDPKILADVINDFIQQPEKLLDMAEAAGKIAKPEALTQVITHCIEVSRESKLEPKSKSSS